MKERFMVIPAVYIIFRRDNKILLIRRFNTGYMDGSYSLPAGHVDGNEAAVQAAVREAYEEVGVRVRAEDLSLVHLMHRRHAEGSRPEPERVDMFFEASKWQGEVTNMEPDKCDDVQWYSLDELPETIIPLVADALRHANTGTVYSDLNFTVAAPAPAQA